MQCPYCQFIDTKVLDSRLTSTLDSVRRRRTCPKCAKRFTTYERTELLDLSVVKKDKRRELFDRQKLLRGVVKACEKRPVKIEKIQKLVEEVENSLKQFNKTEIPSRKIGELVVERLKHLDGVAYVRFASVYRRFTDANQFSEEVAKLKSLKNNKK